MYRMLFTNSLRNMEKLFPSCSTTLKHWQFSSYWNVVFLYVSILSDVPSINWISTMIATSIPHQEYTSCICQKHCWKSNNWCLTSACSGKKQNAQAHQDIQKCCELSPTCRGGGFVRRLVFKFPPKIRQPLFLQACPLRHYRIGLLSPQRYFFLKYSMHRWHLHWAMFRQQFCTDLSVCVFRWIYRTADCLHYRQEYYPCPRKMLVNYSDLQLIP